MSTNPNANVKPSTQDPNKHELPLANRDYKVQPVSTDPIPAVSSMLVHYFEIHNRNGMELDGEDVYAIDPELLAKYILKHWANPPELNAIRCVTALRGIHPNFEAIKAGKTAAADVLEYHNDAAFVTADGPDRKRILPLDLLGLSRIYGFHHGARLGPREQGTDHGGEWSDRAIVAIDEFLAEVGLKPNHPVIARKHCQKCGRNQRYSINAKSNAAR